MPFKSPCPVWPAPPSEDNRHGQGHEAPVVQGRRAPAACAADPERVRRKRGEQKAPPFTPWTGPTSSPYSGELYSLSLPGTRPRRWAGACGPYRAVWSGALRRWRCVEGGIQDTRCDPTSKKAPTLLAGCTPPPVWDKRACGTAYQQLVRCASVWRTAPRRPAGL